MLAVGTCAASAGKSIVGSVAIVCALEVCTLLLLLSLQASLTRVGLWDVVRSRDRTVRINGGRPLTDSSQCSDELQDLAPTGNAGTLLFQKKTHSELTGVRGQIILLLIFKKLRWTKTKCGTY